MLSEGWPFRMQKYELEGRITSFMIYSARLQIITLMGAISHDLRCNVIYKDAKISKVSFLLSYASILCMGANSKQIR
jgi:hypothetical protein